MPALNLTEITLEAINSSSTSLVPMFIVEISHASAPTFRFVTNTEDVLHQADIYQASNVTLELPDDVENEVPQGTIRIEDIEQEIIDDLRSIPTTPGQKRAEVAFSLITDVEPDVKQIGPRKAEVLGFDYTAKQIDLQVGVDNLLRRKFTAHGMTPSNVPAIFTL